MEEMSLEMARKSYATMCSKLNIKEDVFRVIDKKIQGFKNDIGFRIYTPKGEGPFPVLVYFHGGGWVIGDINTHDSLCRSITNQAECVVISVDYSLAPEEKFPVAVEDAFQAVKWIHENTNEINVDPDMIAVGGDSAGGNLAAVVTYLTRERNGPSIMFQLLIYPSTGFTRTASYEKYSEGYHLTKGTMTWFRDHYFNSLHDVNDPLAAPILIEDLLGFPQAYILTAEYDPLRDSGKLYADRLRDAGVEVEYVCCKGMIHGFICMTEALDDAKIAITNLSNALQKAFKRKRDAMSN
jgi:acetyl esterase